jgi:hypothetical protein
MNHHLKYCITLLLLIILVTSSCNPVTQTDSILSSTPISQPTKPVIRILDLSSLSGVIPSPTLGLSNNPQAPSATLPPAESSPQPTATYTTAPIVVINTTASGCTNKAEFIKSLSVNLNTVIKAGEFFTKVWLIKNVGTCTWTTKYSLVFVSGEPMQSPPSLPLPEMVKPDETVDLRITLVAPMNPNQYSGQWMLKDEAGNLFGIGDLANQPLIVQIVVPNIIKPCPI